jgi:hypothetical protein
MDRASFAGPFFFGGKPTLLRVGKSGIMGISEGWVWVVVGSVVAMAIALWLVIAARRSARTGAVYQVQRQFHNVKILASCDRVEFRGLDRAWDGQWKGQGILVLTDDCLYFRLDDREMDLSVPISRIERVDLAGEEESAAQRRRQMRVAYRAFDDQPRVATWILKDAKGWKDLILTTMEGNR